MNEKGFPSPLPEMLEVTYGRKYIFLYQSVFLYKL